MGALAIGVFHGLYLTYLWWVKYNKYDKLYNIYLNLKGRAINGRKEKKYF